MKIKSIIFAFFLLLLFFTACKGKKSTETVSGEALLAIDVEWYFDNDLIQVELDGEILHEGYVTTNYSISLAWSTRDKYRIGAHRMKFIIPEKDLQESYAFILRNTLTIRIRFDKEENKIDFEEYNGILMRD